MIRIMPKLEFLITTKQEEWLQLSSRSHNEFGLPLRATKRAPFDNFDIASHLVSTNKAEVQRSSHSFVKHLLSRRVLHMCLTSNMINYTM